jgi:hypothetical protein
MSDGNDPESGTNDVTQPAAPEKDARRPRASERSGRRRAGSRQQDLIANQLQRVYDEALGEAIPESMLKLLERLDEAPQERPENGK